MSSESTGGIVKDEKRNGIAVSSKEVDTAAQLAAGLSGTLDPKEALRIRKKIDKHILPLMCMLFVVEFMDKTALGNSAVLGIETATNLTANQYNWLGTIFYLSCLLFEYPQSLALQRLPVGKWMSTNIFVWAIALSCTAACKNFTELFIVRFVLGMCEGSITAGFLIVSAMFYTRKEQTLRVGYWFLMSGIAHIISNLLAFGSLHIQTNGFEPWQWYMIIIGTVTLILAICFGFLFPDSPTTAWFLTPDERVKAIQRIKENQTGVENKHFKMEQFMEAMRDPKTWLFAAFAAFDNVPSSLINQQSLLVASLGFTFFQTTLLTMIPGVIEILTIYSGVRLAARLKNGRAYVGAIYFVPALVGIALVNLLPWSDTAGLLVGQFMTGICTTGFVVALSWLGNVTAGHTKRVITNAIILSAFCIGNIVGPLLWQAQYKPRYHVPWAVIAVCYCVCPMILLVIRALLNRENRRRDSEPSNEVEEYYIEKVTEDGKRIEVKVDKEFLDLTDRQNRDFRYVL
ncbi:MFS general substrate transporter [Pisolithus croceorrhizus]|nr:MFS general substrate transporter [Pisolithus croceorrhizus]KAI6134249.1 MFS general substrate transporter [Pisolithus croceorrhizus]